MDHPLTLVVTMPDNSRWGILAEPLARDRAAYFAEHDTGAKSGPAYDTHFSHELAFSLRDRGELMDWITNNYNWRDLRQAAVRLDDAPAIGEDWETSWNRAEKALIPMALPVPRKRRPRNPASIMLSPEAIGWLVDHLEQEYPGVRYGHDPQTDGEAQAHALYHALTDPVDS